MEGEWFQEEKPTVLNPGESLSDGGNVTLRIGNLVSLLGSIIVQVS